MMASCMATKREKKPRTPLASVQAPHDRDRLLSVDGQEY
jgi:hypothetical protein